MNYFFDKLITRCRKKQIEEIFPQLEEEKKKEEEKKEDKRRAKKEEVKIEEPPIEEVVDKNTIELDENEVIDFLIEWIETKDERKKELEKKSANKN